MVSLLQARGELRERFYHSVAETLTLLHTAPGYDRAFAMSEVAGVLATIMDIPLVWIGRRAPGQLALTILAAAGPAAEYASLLELSADENDEGGKGPAGIALRQECALAVSIDASNFVTWRDSARRYGLGSCIVAAFKTNDGGQLALSAYSSDTGPTLNEELVDWGQRLVQELARFWDAQGLLEKNLRMSRYRDAQRTIQRALLDQPDPHAVYTTLAQSLADIAGAAAVDVYAVDETGNALERVALVGPMAEAMHLLPTPTIRSDGPTIYTPTRALMSGSSVVRIRPSENSDISAAWQKEPLAKMGAVGCWPFFATPANEHGVTRKAAGVFAIVTPEPDAFDAEMCSLLDEIADAAGLALLQHQQRAALMLEKERQTYLALHDVMTDLPNRRALDHHLDGVLSRVQNHRQLVALGLLDLDDLKPINDRYGHATGDRLLKEVATRLRAALRTQDYVARLGGDEFVLVFEDIASEHDLEVLLARVWDALHNPMLIDDAVFQLSASLGIALSTAQAKVTGEQLLRRADQAMYQVKARKRHRAKWWSIQSPTEDFNGSSLDHDGRLESPYGELASTLVGPWSRSLIPKIPELVDGFYGELLLDETTAKILASLPAPHVQEIKDRIAQHVSLLLRPEVGFITHEMQARESGFFYGASGVEEVCLLEAVEQMRDLLAKTFLETGSTNDRRPLSIILQRLALDRQWKLESMRELQRRRVAVIARLTALAWSADSYLELIQGAVDILVVHQEIRACAVGRPDASARLTYEAVAGEAFTTYLRALALGEALPIRVNIDSCPSGRAWRSAVIEHCLHYGSDAAMENWREIALSIGIVSSVALPLCPVPHQPAAILALYSEYPGGFTSDDQQAFVDQIKTVLDLALARLAPPRPGTQLLPFVVRERWRAMIATDSIVMHYQPVVRLADGHITELEALARLREIDGRLVTPGRFLPALGDPDLFRLFRIALSHAVACRQSLVVAGHALDISINVPAVALEDPDYAQAAAEILIDGGCPPSSVLLEILESPLGAEYSSPLMMAGTQALKALGIRLVEDDLGAGYSSLIRLRQWPFDRVKIDQAIVLQVADDPLRTLRFIRQLIRLGHDLELEVVVEGLETPGLIEVALILGADLGQGYALAHPMPLEVLRDWLPRFDLQADRTHPRTSAGALAAVLLWEEQFIALPSDATFWEQHAQASSARCLHGIGNVPDTLLESHQAMCDASRNGPLDAGYRAARETFVAMLVERTLVEEQRADRSNVVMTA